MTDTNSPGTPTSSSNSSSNSSSDNSSNSSSNNSSNSSSNNSSNNSNNSSNNSNNSGVSINVTTTDSSNNVIITSDISNNTTTFTNNAHTNIPLDNIDTSITNLTLDQTINEVGDVVVNQQGATISGNVVTHTTFTTTDTTSDAQITQNLIEVVSSYYDDSAGTNQQLINQISDYAQQIQCSDFHGKGTIDDYSALFNAASKIASESKQIALDIEIDGFNDFAKAADDLSSLFSSFIIKLQNVNIINDTIFLTSIISALQSIVNLSNTFGRFKETILATTSIQLPKSAHDSKVILENVTNELNCAMKYISYFVDSSGVKPSGADLSTQEQQIISSAVNTIDNWNTLCDQGITIALNNNPDIQYISQMNNDLKNKTNILKNATNALKNKFAFYNINK
jgi:hypothetical protein